MKKNLLAILSMLSVSLAYAQCPPGETEVTMTIVADRYGEETEWEVTGPGGTPVYGSGGPYTNQSSNGEYPQAPVSFCVPDGSTIYVTVTDDFGDGMCCAYGNGSWTISVGGTDVSSGGTFSDEENASVTIGTDLGIFSSDIPDVIAQGSTTVSGLVKNNGTASVSGFTIDYTIDSGSPVQETFSGTAAPGATLPFSFAVPWNAAVGNHTLDFDLTGVTGDAVSSNNTLSQDVAVATQSVQRVTLVEEFTSSTCGPCAGFNSSFDPTLTSLNTNQSGSNVAAIKYQMDWPAPGTDPSFNSEGSSRRGYYGVTGIPSPFLDGAQMQQGNAAELNAGAAKAAFMDIDLDVTRNGMGVTVTANVTPYANFSGTHKLHLVAVEEFYDYSGGTTSQNEYHFAQRKMLPNENGSTVTLTAGSTQSITESHTFSEAAGIPSQGSHDLWETLNDVIIVAFVQNNSTKEIIQAAFASVPVVDGVHDLTSNVSGMAIYPNPTSDNTTLKLELKDTDQGVVEIIDMRGSIVYQKGINNLSVGMNTLDLETNNLTSGLYTVNLKLESGMIARRLSVIR